jgi:hypothetical protein
MQLKKSALICSAMLCFVALPLHARSPAPQDATAFIITPQDGATVTSPVTVKFGVKNMSIAPAGDNKPASGHFHLLVDTDGLPPLDQPIPKDAQHIHYGKGQSEATLELPPGRHTLQLLLGDFQHIPHQPPVASDRITITVVPH